MPKPDFNELSKKLNIQGLIDNVKSMINPEGNTPKPAAGDEMGEKMANISMSLQDCIKALSEQAKSLNTINQGINDLFKDLEAIRAQAAKSETSGKEEKVAEAVATDEGMPQAPKAAKKGE